MGLFKMSKRAIEVLDGEYYIDMNKKPCKTIWEAAAINNKRPLKVRRHVCVVMIVFLWGVNYECYCM